MFKGAVMGTKADFYVGTGNDMEWLGSIFNEGDVTSIPLNILIQINQVMFEELILEFLQNHDSVISDREDKWNHPWADSRLTDYTYMFDTAREKVVMYQSGIDYVTDPLKILQGYSIMESIELYRTPKFQTMLPDQLMKTEELLREYGYTNNDPM